MGIFIVEPIFTDTTGGQEAIITGIDASSEGLIVGQVSAPNGTCVTCRWNLAGATRDGLAYADLDLSEPTLSRLVGLASRSAALRLTKAG